MYAIVPAAGCFEGDFTNGHKCSNGFFALLGIKLTKLGHVVYNVVTGFFVVLVFVVVEGIDALVNAALIRGIDGLTNFSEVIDALEVSLANNDIFGDDGSH